MIFGATNILTQSLWRDESFSAILSIKNLSEIIPITAKDFSPPLYYFFLHFWIKLFGFSEIALRLSSLLLLTLTAVGTYFLTKKLFSKKAGLLAFFLILLNPFLFYYGFEARFYTLFCFLAVLSFYFLVTERWSLFVFLSLLGLYSHNFMAFSLIGEILAYVLLKGFGKKRQLFLSLMAISLGFLPWTVVLFSQAKTVAGGFWIPRPEIEDIFKSLTQFMTGPLGDYPKYLFFATLVLFPALVWLALSRRENKTLLIWAFTPLILCILISYFIPIFMARYLIFIVIPLSTVSAFLLLKPLFRVPLILCLLTLFLIRDFQLWQNPDKFPIREKVAAISQSWSGEPIVCESVLNFFEVKYYLLRFRPEAIDKLYLLSSGRLMFAGGALAEEGEVVESPPRENYFRVSVEGKVSYEFGGYALLTPISNSKPTSPATISTALPPSHFDGINH